MSPVYNSFFQVSTALGFLLGNSLYVFGVIKFI
jgi:hypothetical protein